MCRGRWGLVLFICGLSYSTGALAEQSWWTFYAENDLFAPSQDDNSYTGALALSLSGPRSARYPISLDPLLGTLNAGLPVQALRGEAGSRFHALELGIAGFTPSDTRSEAPVPDQHPYGCLTFLTSSRLDVEPKEDTAWLSSLSLGLLGTSACQQIQRAVHSAEGEELPAGWNNQISDGGEPTGLWTLAWAQQVRGEANSDLSAHLETSLGFATHVGLGMNWRRGRISSPWWSWTPHHTEFVTLGDFKPHGSPGERFFFAGIRLQYRFYSALLQGQFRDSAVTFSRSELQPMILEGWGGFAASLGPDTELIFRLHGRRSEIRGKPASSWGSIGLRHRY